MDIKDLKEFLPNKFILTAKQYKSVFAFKMQLDKFVKQVLDNYANTYHLQNKDFNEDIKNQIKAFAMDNIYLR